MDDKVEKAKPGEACELTVEEEEFGTTADRLAVVCATKGIELEQVEQVEWNEVDILLALKDGTVVCVEISSLPAGLLESSVPVPETTQVVEASQPPAKVSKKRSKAKRGKERV